MRLVLEGYRCLYLPRIREGSFSETGLPTNPILGNSSLAPFLFPRPRGEVLASICTAKERMRHNILRFCKKAVYVYPWAALGCIL
jgi:hypothetical protein